MSRFSFYLMFFVITALLVPIVNEVTGLQLVGSMFARVTHNVLQQIIGFGTIYILFFWRTN